MQKIFDIWNGIKKKIDLEDNKKINISEREIWFVSMGKNIGFEQDGKGKDFYTSI